MEQVIDNKEDDRQRSRGAITMEQMTKRDFNDGERGFNKGRPRLREATSTMTDNVQ